MCRLLHLSRLSATGKPTSFPTRRSSDLFADIFSPFSRESLRFWALCILPTGISRFVIIPACFLPLGVYAAVNVFVTVVDRQSTRLKSSHLVISYAVFYFKHKNDTEQHGT